MIKKLVIIALFLFCVLFVKSTHALNIGVSPSVADLGNVEKGSQHVVDIYPSSDNNKDLVLTLVSAITIDTFYNPNNPRPGYTFDPYEASEERVEGWITLLKNPTVLPPTQRLYILKDGTATYANKRLSVILSIPEDVEPGYHAGTIRLDPKVSFQGSGPVLNIVTNSLFRYVFRVDGKVERSGYVKELKASNDGDRVIVDALFVNNGTVTLRAVLESVVLSQDGNSISASQKMTELVSPGTARGLRGFFYGDIEPGIYTVTSTVSWIGGKDFRKALIEIPQETLVPKVTGKEVAKQQSSPLLWPFVLLTAVAVVVIYSRKRKRITLR